MTGADNDTNDDPPRDRRTTGERLELLERDVRSHARSLTAFVEAGKSFTKEQMEQMRTLLREELGDVGLRIDGPDHVDEVRKDFMFLRSLRNGMNGTASKIGWFFIAALLTAVVWLINSGLTFWKGH